MIGRARFLTVAAWLAVAACLSAAIVNTTITYLKPPTNCFTPPGYTDAAVCEPPQEIPLGSFPLPAVGGTYMDPTFGATVRLLSAPRGNHGYSTPSPLSATGRLAAIVQSGQQVNLVEVSSGNLIYAGRPGNVTSDSIRWDALDDNVYYWFSGTRVMRHRLQENQTDVLLDYATNGHRFTSISAGGTGDVSKDNWISFTAQSEHIVCALNLRALQTYCADYRSPAVTSRIPVDYVDYSLMSKGADSVSGKRYVLLMAWPALAAFSVDEANRRLRFEHRGSEFASDMQGARGNRDGVCDPGEACLSTPHGDVMEDSDGQQYFVNSLDMEQPCARQLATFRLNAGVRMVVDTALGGGRSTGMTLHRCNGGPYENWVSNHVGCARQAAYCTISTDGADRNPLDTITPIQHTTHLGEVLVMRGNLLEVRRLAHHRSLHLSNNRDIRYWSSARAAISGDGKIVLWDSNYGRSGVGEYVVAAYADQVGRSGSLTAGANPIVACGVGGRGAATLKWSSTGTTAVSVRVNAPNGPAAVLTAPPSGALTTRGVVINGMRFYLQDVSDGLPLTSANTLATLTLTTTTAGCPRSGSLTATASASTACGTPAVVALTWRSINTTAISIRAGGPNGQPVVASAPSSGAASTTQFSANGTVFYLQDVSAGLPLTNANTLSTWTLNAGTQACAAVP